MTRPDFNKALLKGEVGEELIKPMLESKGYIVYQPNTNDKPHAFDILAIKDKRKVIAMDVKAKARRNSYPDTGVDMRLYRGYKRFSEKHNMDFYLVFVDEMLKKIYGNSIRTLDSEITLRVRGKRIIYPWVFKGIRYWPLRSMVSFGTLPEDAVQKLIELSQRSYDYLEAR